MAPRRRLSGNGRRHRHGDTPSPRPRQRAMDVAPDRQAPGSEAAQHADFSGIRYAQCWEDADVLLDALSVRPGDRCLSVASGGENSLSLLACEPGAVVAVDISPAQIALVELKRAAIRTLDHGAAIAFVGLASGADRLRLYRDLRAVLPGIAPNTGTRTRATSQPAFAPGVVSSAIWRCSGASSCRSSTRARDRLAARAAPARRAAPLLRRGLGQSTLAPAHPRLLLAYGDGPPRARPELLSLRRGRRRRVDLPAGRAGIDRGRAGRQSVPALDCPRPLRRHVAARLARGQLRRHPPPPRPARAAPASVEAALASAPTGASTGSTYRTSSSTSRRPRAERMFDDVARCGRAGGRVAYWNMMVPRAPPPRLAATAARTGRRQPPAAPAGDDVLLRRLPCRRTDRSASMTVVDVLHVFLLLAVAAGMIAGLRCLQLRRRLEPELVRKMFHISGGIIGLALPWLFDSHRPGARARVRVAGGFLAMRSVAETARGRGPGAARGAARDHRRVLLRRQPGCCCSGSPAATSCSSASPC